MLCLVLQGRLVAIENKSSTFRQSGVFFLECTDIFGATFRVRAVVVSSVLWRQLCEFELGSDIDVTGHAHVASESLREKLHVLVHSLSSSEVVASMNATRVSVEASGILEQLQRNAQVDAIQRLMPILGQCACERFYAVYVDANSKILDVQLLGAGDETRVELSVGDVCRAAVANGAVSLIVAHNHPGGDVQPSNEDVRLTKRLRLALTVLGVPLWDHLIFSNSTVYSMADRGPWDAPLDEFRALVGDVF